MGGHTQTNSAPGLWVVQESDPHFMGSNGMETMSERKKGKKQDSNRDNKTLRP